MKKALAAKLYDDEMLSLGEASNLAEMNKIDFIEYLGESNVPVIRFSNESCSGDIEADLANSRKYDERYCRFKLNSAHTTCCGLTNKITKQDILL